MLQGKVALPELTHVLRVVDCNGLDGAALRKQLVLQVAASSQGLVGGREK